MSNLATIGQSLPATTPEALQKILAAEQQIMQAVQIEVQTEHVLHAGMYGRTVRLAPWVVIVGALMKVPTLLIVNGKCRVYAGDRWYASSGYQVIPAKAGRKQIFITEEPTEITMIFPTKARTIAEAEAEFTDETEKLISRRQDNGDIIMITSDQPCLE